MARDVYVKKENLEDVISGIEKKVPKAVPSVILKKDVIWEGVGTELNQELELLNDIENYDEVEIYLVNGDGYHTSSNSCLVESTPFNLRSQWVYRNLTLCCAINVSFLGAKRAKITESANLGAAIHLSRIVGVKYTYEKNIPNASPTAKGKAKLYDALGNNEDGAINQKAVTEAIHSMGSGIADWTANTEYSQGISVVYNHVLYKCTADHTSGTTFAPTYWNKIGVDASGDTFTGDVDIYGAELHIKDTSLVKGTDPASTTENLIKFNDSANAELGSVKHSISDTGVATTEIVANEFVAGDTTHKASVSVSMDKSGNAVAKAPSTPDDSVNDEIVTADYLNDALATKIIKPWTANTQYKLNTTVVNSNVIYKCTTAHTSGVVFDDTNWQKIGVNHEGDTFTGNVNFSGDNRQLVFNDTTTKGTIPSGDIYKDISFEDSVGGSTQHRYGIIRQMELADGSNMLMLRAYKNDDSDTTSGTISIIIDSSGNVTTSAPNATGSGSAPIMTTAGGEFTSDVTLNTSGNTTSLNLKSNNFTKGDTPSSEKTTGIFFRDGTSVGNSLGSVHNFVSASGEVTTVLRAYKNEAGSSSNAYIYVRVKPDGTIVTYAPTPPRIANNTMIATTAWVRTIKKETVSRNTTNTTGGQINYQQCGSVVKVNFNNMAINSGSSLEICSGLPKADIDYAFGMLTTTSGNATALIRVNNSGVCHAWNNTAGTTYLYGSITYLTQEAT